MAPRLGRKFNPRLETRQQYNRRMSAGKAGIEVTGVEKSMPNIKGQAKAKKDVSTSVRNQVIRYFSDYLSEEIPGFGKKTPNAQAFRNYTGLTGDISPDAQVDIPTFEKTTGIQLSQTKILKDKIAFFETKISGLGAGGTGVSFTALELGKKGSSEFQITQEQLSKIGKTNITGIQAYNLLFTNNQLQGKANQIIKAIEAKFENLLIVNAYDKEKTGKRTLQFNFIEGPLKNVNLKDPNSFNKYISLRIRPRTESSSAMKKAGRTEREIVSFRVEAVPTPRLQQEWKAKDITKKIQEAHKGAISTGAKKYITDRIMKYANEPGNRNKQDKITDLLAFTEALATEFKEGGFTPLTMSTTIKSPTKLGLKEGRASLIGKTSQDTKPQRFISGVQLTQLVQKRLGKTMRKFGDPEAPDLTERTGTFRNSVNIIANYRRGVIMYYYNPIYDSLNKYGYKPSEQVGRATREVVQSLYARAFNIVKG